MKIYYVILHTEVDEHQLLEFRNLEDAVQAAMKILERDQPYIYELSIEMEDEYGVHPVMDII